MGSVSTIRVRPCASAVPASSAWSLLVLAAALAALGCTSRPRAPALIPESIYQNDQIGLRFEAPEDWVVHAKSILAAGESLPNERMLVGYKRPRSARPASFELACWDAPETAKLVEHFTGKRSGPEAWRQVGEVETLTVGGRPARRLVFLQSRRDFELRKEVTAVWHNGRFIFFTLVAAPDDAAARDEARRAVASAAWKN